MAGSGDLEVLLLGPLEVRRDGEPLRLGRGKARTLLADLALHLGEVVSVDRLVDDLWGERPPRSAAHAVEVYVSQLRRELGPALLTRSPGYALELEPRQVDALRFAERAAEGSRLVDHDPQMAGGILRGALALWRGPALAEFAFEPFAQTEIARFEELRQECLEDRVEADLAAGRHLELVPELEALVRAEPLRERMRGQLMLALYRSGRAPDALAAYGETRQMLLDELGIEPGVELRKLEGAILRQDESLVAPLAQASLPRAPQRRVLTVVAAGLDESPEGLDTEVTHARVVRWHEHTSAVVMRYGGRMQSISDDAVAAVFGLPFAREDDTLRAARAALELRETQARIGVETGEVAADGVLVAGPALSGARAAMRTAEPGTVMLGEQATAILAHAIRFEPGTSRLLEVAAEVAPSERRLDAPLVGRTVELAKLHDTLDDAIRDSACRAVWVVGEAGIGKTRLAQEFAEAVKERAGTLRGTCVAEGAASPYQPLLHIVQEALGAIDGTSIAARVDESAAAVLAAALGAGEGNPSPPEVAWAFRRFCDALAADRPLVLLLDDVQWAEPTLRELIEQLAARSHGPMLLICLAREEALGSPPSFLTDAGRIALDVLTRGETSALLRSLAGARRLSDDVLDRVVESSEGNPLFVEQLLAFVTEEGTLVDRPLPPTIRALLAARFDRLGPGERAVVSRAAVVGREFSLRNLSALFDGQGATTAKRHLNSLVGRGFVRAVDGEYRFRHVLVHEAAYRATSKFDRAELHERLADHLARAQERDDLVGVHLERAHALHSELGSDERRVRQLATDAGTRLGAAGILAWKRNDVPASIGLLRRATGLLEPESALARDLTCELGLALRAGGDAEGATEALLRASRSRSSVGDAHIELRARMELAFVRLLEEGRGARDHELVELAETAIPTFEALKDDRALGRAWLVTGYVHGARHLRCKAWEHAAERALVHYQRSGWPAATCLGQLANALYHGPVPAAEAARRCEALLAAEPGLAGEANVLVCLGGLVAMLGRLDDGRAFVARARAMLDELGQVGAVGALYGKVAGAIEVFACNFTAAERILRESCALLEQAGLRSTLASRAGELAGVLYARGSYVDADEWATAAERAASEDDLDARLAWQPVRAKLVALSGDLERAEDLAKDAVALAERTDAINQRARVLLDFAEVQRLCGHDEEAAALVDQAHAEYEQKGNRLGAERLKTPA